MPPHSPLRKELVLREVPRQPLPRRSLCHRAHQQLAADERAAPGRAEPAEQLVTVAAGARLAVADLERTDLRRESLVRRGVVRGQRGDERAVGGVHRRQQLRLRVDQDDRVDRAERLRVMERRGRRRVQQGDGLDVRRGVLAGQEAGVGHVAPVQRDGAAVDRLGDLVVQLLGLGGVDHRPEVQLRIRVVALLDRKGVPDLERAHRRQVGRQELVEQLTLDDEAWVRRAALLAVVEELGDDGRERVPVGVVPDAPGVESLLFEYMSLSEVGYGRGHRGAGVAAADEGDAADLGRPHQRLGQLAAAAADEGDGKPLAGGERAGQGQTGDTAVGRGLGDDCVACQCLYQHCVNEHAHRVVPARDIGNRPVQRGPAGDHRLDAVDVPAHAVDGPVDVRLREPPGLADLPDEQQGEQFTVLGQGVEGRRDACPAFLQRDVSPRAVLVERGAYGLVGGVSVQARRAGDRAAVDGAGGGQGAAVGLPGGVPEVEDTVVPEGLRGDGQAALPGVCPGGA